MSAAQKTLVMASVVGLGGLLAPGCYGNALTEFPAGFEPWEAQMSEPAPGTPTDPCPETLVHVESRGYMGGRPAAVHASACIHAPLATVWAGVQDPQTARDPGVNRWTLFDAPMSECADGAFETGINAGSPVSVDFRLCFRFAVAAGTEAAPTRVVARWQKVFGTTAISTLEGSIVLEPFPGDPSFTIVDYQYHLAAATTGPSNYQTINEYLDVIYDRLRRRSHGETL